MWRVISWYPHALPTYVPAIYIIYYYNIRLCLFFHPMRLTSKKLLFPFFPKDNTIRVFGFHKSHQMCILLYFCPWLKFGQTIILNRQSQCIDNHRNAADHTVCNFFFRFRLFSHSKPIDFFGSIPQLTLKGFFWYIPSTIRSVVFKPQFR